MERAALRNWKRTLAELNGGVLAWQHRRENPSENKSTLRLSQRGWRGVSHRKKKRGYEEHGSCVAAASLKAGRYKPAQHSTDTIQVSYYLVS